jgi:hypothetical protein
VLDGNAQLSSVAGIFSSVATGLTAPLSLSLNSIPALALSDS